MSSPLAALPALIRRHAPPIMVAALILAVWLEVAPHGSLRPTAQAQDESLEPVSSTPAASAESPPRPRQRTLFDTLQAGGTIGWLIMLLSVVSLGFIVEHALTIRKTTLMPDHVVADLDQFVRDGKLDEAAEYCSLPENRSLFADVVAAGLERFRSSDFGFAEYKAACEEAGEDQTSRLYRKTEVVGVIGVIAPMLGLLGTVSGMIQAFNIIAEKEGMARPSDLAGAISEALVTTFQGLCVAIPTMVAFSFFRNKIDSIVSEAGKRVEQILAPLARRRG